MLAGEPFDEQEKQLIATTYMSCAEDATVEIVGILQSRIEGFSEVEKKIVEGVESD